MCGGERAEGGDGIGHLVGETGEDGRLAAEEAIQMHGGAGVSNDFPLAYWYAMQRTLRLADGPDEVHRNVVARIEFGKYR